MVYLIKERAEYNTQEVQNNLYQCIIGKKNILNSNLKAMVSRYYAKRADSKL